MKDLCQKWKLKLIFRGAWNSLMAWPDWPWPPHFTTDLRHCVGLFWNAERITHRMRHYFKKSCSASVHQERRKWRIGKIKIKLLSGYLLNWLSGKKTRCAIIIPQCPTLWQWGRTTTKKWKKRSERHKHCALAVVRRSQKYPPHRRTPSRGRGAAKI